jgi:hypothetical protein
MAHMAAVVAEFETWQTAENADEMAADLEGYRVKYLRLLHNMLQAKANCISSFIAGPSNFPVRRAQKASDRADKHTRKLLDYQDWKLSKLRRKYNPRLIARRPIGLGDDDAIEKIEKQIARLERSRKTIKAANRIARDKKLTAEEKFDELINTTELTEHTAREIMKPNWAGKVGFETYVLTNIGANIRRYKERLVQIERERNRGASEYETPNSLEIVENTDETRIQLIFDDKPPAEVRTLLKQNGFHWSPTQGAWQRLLNENGRQAAQRAVDLINRKGVNHA